MRKRKTGSSERILFRFQIEKGGMLISPRTQIFFEDLSHISSRSHLEVMPDWPVPTVAVYEKVRGRLPFRMVLTLKVMALPSEVT